MRYISRDPQGVLTGSYANPQPGLAVEAVADDYPGLYLFENPAPITVTPAQAKLALFNAGLLDKVEASISTASKPVQIYWANALSFERRNPYILGIAGQLGLTDAQMDDLFKAASAL
jgi:hypothetical protein